MLLMDGSDESVPLHQYVTNWLTALPVDTVLAIILFDLCALAVVLYALLRRRQGYRWWRWPLPAVIPFLLLAALTAVNVQLGYVHTLGSLVSSLPYEIGPTSLLTTATGNYPQGVVVEATIPSPTSNVGSFPALIFLPPQYFTETPARQFPVAYLLPGSPGQPKDWFIGGDAATIGLASADQQQPMVLVSPTVGPEILSDTECVNGPQGNWETYLAIDVVDWVTQNSRVIPGAQGQVVAGLSMGGYCAQMLALRNPTRFMAYGNFSGFTVPTYDAGLPALFGDVANLGETVASYSASWILANQPQSHSVHNWLGAGTEDEPEILAQQLAFVSLAKRLQLITQFQELTGAHTFYVWQESLTLWLPWAYAQLPPASKFVPPQLGTPASKQP